MKTYFIHTLVIGKVSNSLYKTNPLLAYQYLKDYYKSMDIDWIKENQIKSKCIKSSYTYTFSNIKKEFFDKFIKKHGKLFCQVCKKDIFSIKSKSKNKNAGTIDHIIPLSEGGLRYNEVNFICACDSCNNDRGSRPLYKILNTEFYFYK